MHQQFPNVPMEKCDPQTYLGQGHFSNLSHHHREHNKSSALTSADLEDAARLRMVQHTNVRGPNMAFNVSSTAYQKQPVDASGLKCPIIMMSNPFRRETDDRDRAAGFVGVETAPDGEISRPQQGIGLDRAHFVGSEQSVGNPDNHRVRETNTGHGFCHNDDLHVSAHRANQYHPLPPSDNQDFRMPRNRFCDYTQNYDNDGQVTECGKLGFRTDTHQQDLYGQCQDNSMAYIPPHAVFPSVLQPGLQPRHAGRNQYRQNHTEPGHNMIPHYKTRFQQFDQPPRVPGEEVCNDLAFGPANDSQINPDMTSQPMFAVLTTPHYRPYHGMGRTIQQPHPAQECRPGNEAVFNGINMSENGQCSGACNECRHLPGASTGYLHNVKIRDRETCNVRRQLVPGRVLQVHGAPMTGKSTLVRQAISDAISNSQQPGQLCDHHFTCKGIARFQDFLSLIVQNLYPQYQRQLWLDADSVLKMIGSFLQENPLSHHVLVFHKCENLRDNPHGQQFLEFLTRIVSELARLSVSVVFTTYKYYWTPVMSSVAEVQVDVLSIIDIVTLLRYYVPYIDDCVGYANVLAKTFCFPEAVRLIAEEYLSDRNTRVTPEKLEKIINKDQDFLSQLFEHRVHEVDTWVSKEDLLFLTHFKHSVEISFTETHLEYVNSSDLDQVRLQKRLSQLKKNYLVRSLPGIRRLVIHPLLVYHSMVSSSRERQLVPGKWFDNTCNRYTYFLGRVLMSIESSMQEHGRKGLVFAGLIQEWPNVQYVFQMALNCNLNTYANFIKVAITASNYILKIFPKEAETFYWCLYNSAKDYGTPVEMAVMEAFLGQAIAEGTGIAEGKDWPRANQYLSSAIERLSRFGNSYFLAWAIIRKAIIHHRQGKYQDSLQIFDQAANVLNNVDRWALGEQFVVPEAKIDEEMITQRIHMNIPIIFTGRNKEARRRLDKLLELIQNKFENHPDIATLLNLIGLTEQRGNRDNQHALMWYKLSYSERMYWAKACPESLLAVLNNIGMIYFYQGNNEESVKYLEKALAIRRECGWTHYYTGLTLVHVAEIHMKRGNLVQAYKSLLEAERILSATVKDHDMKLRVNSDLAHVRVFLRQALEPECSAARQSSRSFHSQGSCEQNETTSEVRCTQGRCQGQGTEANDAYACKRTRDRKISLNTIDESVTSSQIFEPGYGSQRSDTSSHPFPAPEDILCIQAAEIEPCDLRMSAEDYFERLMTVANTMQGTLSDDGLSIVLCSLEHCMLFNLGNSPEKFEKHRLELLKFSKDNPWLEVDGDVDTGVDSKYRCLIKHKPLYNYILSTPYENLNIRTFAQHMLNACLTCKFVNDIISVEKWETEAVHCIQERQIRMRRKQEFDAERLSHRSSEHGNVGNITASSTAAENVTACDIFVDLGQNCVCTNVNTQNVPSTRNEMFLQQTQAVPNFEQLLSSQNSFQDGGNMKGLPHTTAGDQSEPSDVFLGQSSLVLPRIAKIQDDIWKNIQNKKDMCLLSASRETEKSVSDSPSVCGKTYSDRRSIGVPGILTPRMPVEQSYHGNQDTALSSDGILLPWCDRKLSNQASACNEIQSSKVQPFREFHKQTENLEQRKRHMHKKSRIPDRQILANSDQQKIATDHISNQVLPDDVSTSQLVLEKCRSDLTSQSESTSGGISDLHSSTSEQKYGQESAGNKSCKTSADVKFSVLDYIRYAFNMNLITSPGTETSASRSHQEAYQQHIQHPVQQRPFEEQPVTRVQDEAVDGGNVALHGSSTSSLINKTKFISASPSSQLHEPAPFLENYLCPCTVPSGKHGQECVTEGQPQLHVRGVDVKEAPGDPEDILDSGLDSALVGNINDHVSANRQASGRSRVVSSSSSSLSVSSHSCSHVTSTIESGYSSEQHLTGMSKTRPITCVLRGARDHKNYCTGSQLSQALSDIPFHSPDGLRTEMGHTNAMFEASGSGHTQNDDRLTAERFIQALAQINFLDQKWQQPPQTGKNLQADNQATEFLSSSLARLPVFTENPNDLISFREPVEQSWNETLVPQPSAEVGDISESGCVIRPELQLLENRIRQHESEISTDSEEVTLAENVNSNVK